MNYRTVIMVSLLLCLVLSGCAAPLPPRTLLESHKPSNPPNLDFPVVIKFDYDFNRFVLPQEFKNGINQYLYEYAPKWKFNFGMFTPDIDTTEKDQLIEIKLKAYKEFLATNDSHADIKISSKMIKEEIELSLSQESRFNGNPESVKVDSYDFGVVVAEGILNALSNNKEFYDNANLLSSKYKDAEQKKLEEEQRKLSPEVSNQEALKHYKNMTITGSFNEVKASIEAYDKAIAEGYKPTHLPSFISSLVVLNDLSDKIEPIRTSKLPLEPIFLDKSKVSSKLDSSGRAIVIQPSSLNIKRDILDQSKVNSKYISGYSEQNNASYDTAYREYIEALNNYNRVQLEVSMAPAPQTALGGLGQGLSNAAKTIPATNRLERAKQILAQTPRTTSVPIEQNYTYNKMKVKVSKEFEYHVYIIDQGKNEVIIKSFPEIESKVFTLEYDKHSNDSGSVSQCDKEEDVTNYEAKKFQLDIKKIVVKLAETPFTSYDTVRYDSSLAFVKPYAKPKEKSSPYIPIAKDGSLNRLISSVVAIKDNGGSTIGTGFFVLENLILTNSHVVDDKQYISVTDNNNNSFTAKTINRSHELDIALLEINGSGHPVEIYSGDPLSEGDEVLAIGNPVGLEFSVTKGIISSIRKRKEMTPLAKEHLYIQTDVPINPGNSGGPLFYNGRVVGINTMKLVSKDVEGIGFAIHYTELLNYLADCKVRFEATSFDASIKKSSKDDASITEKLKRLKALHEGGLIDETEYKEKKKELLKSI